MTQTVLIVIGVIAAVILLKGMITPKKTSRAASGRPGRVTKKTAESAVRERTPYYAVSCSSGTGSCEAVAALADQRFLVEEVPQLPLAACTSDQCKCKYLHHEDRRNSDDDRRALYGIKSEFYGYTSNQDRRVKTGRRESDWEAAEPYGQISSGFNEVG